jgi:hypothetical protein
MESLPQDLADIIEALSEEKKFKILKFITRETEMGGRVPSRQEISTIINYLNESENQKASKELPKQNEKTLRLTKNCSVCKYNLDDFCTNEESELYKSKIFATIVCAVFKGKYEDL